jgi:hypothetical protein
MNLLRDAYLQTVPGLDPFFVTVTNPTLTGDPVAMSRRAASHQPVEPDENVKHPKEPSTRSLSGRVSDVGAKVRRCQAQRKTTADNFIHRVGKNDSCQTWGVSLSQT